MLYKIPDFIQLCRKAGFKIASSEIIDLLKSIHLLGWEKEKVYEAMLSTLVKEEKDRVFFDKLFYYFFTYLLEISNVPRIDLDKLLKEPPRLESAHFQAKLSSLKNTIKNTISQYKEMCTNEITAGCQGGSGQGRYGNPVVSSAEKLVMLLRTGNTKEFKAFVKEHIDQLKTLNGHEPPDISSTMQELKVSMGWAEANHRIEIQEKSNRLSEILKWQENKKQINRIIQNELEETFLRKWPKDALEQIVRIVNTKELEFNLLNEDQIDEIRKALKRLTRKLATRYGYRYKHARKGLIDLRRTAARSIQSAGIPIKLYYRKRIPDRPEIVIIYDLSGSVALFSEFMLQLVYALHKSFNKVHSFAFVDCIEETSTFIKGENLTWEIKNIIKKTKISNTNFSNYGQVWKNFNEKYLNVLTPKTTVLILGDARNNWNPTGEEYLATISKNCKKLIWLNPAPLEKWNTEDSVINIYASYCHQIFECRNLQQLEMAALRVF